MLRFTTLAICFALSCFFTFSQKRPLDHSVYDDWESLRNTTLSDDGRVVATLISPQQGDTILFIQKLEDKRGKLSPGKSITMDRVKSFKLSSNGRFTVGLLKAPYAERRQALIDKKKKEDMPKDSLLIVDNLTFSIKKIANINSYNTAPEMMEYVSYTVTLPADTTQEKDKEKSKDVTILRNLKTGNEDTLMNVKEHVFNKYENSFAVIEQPEEKDTLKLNQVIFFDLSSGNKTIISHEQKEYKSLFFDEGGNQLVYLATGDTSKVEQKSYDLRYYVAGNDTASIIADHNSLGMPQGWIFNEHASPSFSKNGKRILIGAAPELQPIDTTIVDFEMAKLDIWHWQDPLVQPQQLVEQKKEEKRTYKGIVYPDEPDKFTPIANELMPEATIPDEGDGRFVLLWSALPYRLESQWDISSKYDAWVVDLKDNSVNEIGKPLNGNPYISPSGNYVYWWDAKERHWFAYDNIDKSIRNLTKDIPVNFWNERHDTPRNPGSYGIGAWGEDDDFVLINDRFDIWKIYPKGDRIAENITLGTGRADSISFGYLNTDKEKKYIERNELLLLSAFNNTTKERGYYTLKQSGRNPLQKQIMDGFTFTGLQKAKDKDVFAFLKSNFNTSPDLHITNDYWNNMEKLTATNPQMREYNWGYPELFSWTSYADVPLQGIVYKPEDFDPTKKYPVMVYFYEKHSDNLYSYYPPAPSRSIINIPFFVSRGYIVFTPDIDYTVGQPGEDAYNAVVSGAEALAKNAWVDKDNMAIQGQSWGGYQVSYLVTKTDMFKAAGAGAPVSNMTSAYGGIRWESGRSRQSQYEQTQSRIGASMSDSLHLYIKNSPVFFADKVNTPLLIMHNDNDGAVPWYQGIELFMSLRRLNKTVWMLQYNNEAHNLVHRRNTKDLSIRLQQFFDHYLKGDPAPVWMTKGVPASKKGKTWGYELDD